MFNPTEWIKKCLSIIRYMKALPWVEKGAIIWGVEGT